MTSLQHGSNVLSLWSCAAVGSLGYLSAPRHLSQAHEGLNFLHQRLRAHRRPRPMLHPAEGITPWAKGIEGRGPSLSFCLSSGGACSVENKVGIDSNIMYMFCPTVSRTNISTKQQLCCTRYMATIRADLRPPWRKTSTKHGYRQRQGAIVQQEQSVGDYEGE